MTTILLAGLVVFVTHALEGITGFGCSVLALPFLIWLFGSHEIAVPILVVLAWVLALLIVFTNLRHLQKREAIFIMGHALVGLPLGMLLHKFMPEAGLTLLISLFMVVVGTRGLNQLLLRKDGLPDSAAPSAARGPGGRLALLAGGMIHGAFGTGGPLVVIYATRALPDKSQFRANLCLLWSTLNTLMIVRWLYQGDVFNNVEIMNGLLTMMPFMLLGWVVGQRLHDRFDARHFLIAVYSVLTASGFVMYSQNIGRIFSA